MAAKKMEYTATNPLEVSVPDGRVVSLVKGDVVDFNLYGGDAFFAGREDFKEHKAAHKGGSS